MWQRLCAMLFGPPRGDAPSEPAPEPEPVILRFADYVNPHQGPQPFEERPALRLYEPEPLAGDVEVFVPAGETLCGDGAGI